MGRREGRPCESQCDILWKQPSRAREGMGGRSVTPSWGRSVREPTPLTVGFLSPSDALVAEPLESAKFGDSISVTVRFRPLSEREIQRGDEVAWYANGDKIVRNEYNPATAYAFDKVFGPSTNSKDVYDVAARPVVKAAMEGVNDFPTLQNRCPSMTD